MNEVALIPYYDDFEMTLEWYQDLDLCKKVDNIDHPYDLNRLCGMYHYLTEKGELYYISYEGRPVGDIALVNDEVCIVLSRPYQNRHIGRKALALLMERARNKGLKKLKANIYSFNIQSQKMFKSLGFMQLNDEWYEIAL